MKMLVGKSNILPVLFSNFAPSQLCTCFTIAISSGQLFPNEFCWCYQWYIYDDFSVPYMPLGWEGFEQKTLQYALL